VFEVKNGILAWCVFFVFVAAVTESKPDLLSKVTMSNVSTADSSIHNSDSGSVISCNTSQKMPGKFWYATQHLCVFRLAQFLSDVNTPCLKKTVPVLFFE